MPYSRELSFRYRNPTKVVFGEGSTSRVALEMKSLGVVRALIITDEGLAKTDLPERVKSALGDNCVGIFNDVQPDTSLEIVQGGVDTVREVGADLLVSVGGGSSIDTAKAIAVVHGGGGQLSDYIGKRIEGPLIPHIAIPTTSGTGSEVTPAAVVKDREQGAKRVLLSDHLSPKTAILDPLMAVGMPPLLTASTGMDAMTHAVEGVVSLMREPFADAMNLEAIRLIVEYLPQCVDNGDDILARGQQMIGAAMAGMGFGNSMVGIVHAMAHIVGARHGVPHGIANGILLPYGMKYNLAACPDRFALVAEAMGVKEKNMNDDDAASAALGAMSDFIKRIRHPEKLRDVGVPSEDLEVCAVAMISEPSFATNPKPGDLSEVLKLLQEAW